MLHTNYTFPRNEFQKMVINENFFCNRAQDFCYFSHFEKDELHIGMLSTKCETNSDRLLYKPDINF